MSEVKDHLPVGTVFYSLGLKYTVTGYSSGQGYRVFAPNGVYQWWPKTLVEAFAK